MAPNGIGGPWGIGTLVQGAQSLDAAIVRSLASISGSGLGLGTLELLSLSNMSTRRSQLLQLATGLMNAEKRLMDKLLQNF